MKKYIFASAILLVFLFGIMLINHSGKDTIAYESIESTSQVIEEKNITETSKPASTKKEGNTSFTQDRRKDTANALNSSEPKSKYKAKEISKKKPEKFDPYSDALDKKIERDIKEISANYPEKPQGIKDEIDDEMIGLLPDAEEIADNDY